ncbi:amidohydrolase family protein [Roseomonas alkaliterrae]|uniref:Cytosine/adenosine deaminase-related metal-dependent hydrolase n=1 Tax=Neoroseomonas alkaliterrae TaxID=1452450 RepID=A0A840Y8N9_9PROT|nr:amidohydrolase family protein [Neoroseomonas alkaliterrae]MBB5690952.1 cytosine/adenosine deaminase-related metal-dependent hydrolase [Neoroseomonas alkaliterrae]MBR0674673.1 amidohydrolase family protein [Neoroseomonas alkaliterrae]
MTITLIRNAELVVGWDAAAKSHSYMPDTDLAFQGGTITFLGRGYEGQADTVIDGRGLMVMPGLVNIHSHPSSEPLNKGFLDEIGSPGLYNSSLYEFMPIFRADAEAVPHCVRVALSELLLSGVTTLADLSMAHPGWLDLLAEAGMRVCVAPMFRSARWFTKNGHVVEYEWDEKAGEKAMEEALRLIERAEQHECGRLFGMVVPAQIDTCSAGLLKDSFAEAKARGLSWQIHAAQSVVEFHEITRRHGMTPIGWLDAMGLLDERTIIGHGIFLDDHPSTRWHTETDLKRLAETGTTVAHCPTVFARRGIAMKDLGRYMRAGVNMGIGTDTYPHNMLDEMRLAAHIARTQAGHPRTLRTTDLFNAATIGGAKALGRDDIGRLAVGCKADFSLVDITHPMIRPAYDPIRSLIYSAGDRALKALYVDGNKVVEDGEVLTMDYRQAAEHLHEAQKRIVSRVPQQDWAHRSAEKIAPPTFHWS